MSGPWEEYQTQPQPMEAGPWTEYAVSQPAPKAAQPGFWSGMREMVPNPVALIKEYINRPNEYGAALRGMTAALQERRGGVTPETQAAIEEGLGANVHLPGTGSDLIPMGTEGLHRAADNWQQGNRAAAVGNALFAPAVAATVRAVPPLARGVGNAARAGVRAIQSPGALDMAAGATEMAAGVGSTAAGHPFIGTGLAVRGATQFKKGLDARNTARTAPATPQATGAAVRAVELTAHEQSLVEAALQNPQSFRYLKPATRERLIPELNRQGFDFSKAQKPSKAAAAQSAEPAAVQPAPGQPTTVVSMPKPPNPTPAVTAEEAAAAGELSLEDAMRQSVDAVKARKAGQASAPVTTIPHKPDEFAPAQYETSARGVKAGKLSQLLHEHGIPYSDAKLMTPEMWEQLAKAAGVNKPGLETRTQALFELKKLDKKAAPGAGSTAQKVRVN